MASALELRTQLSNLRRRIRDDEGSRRLADVAAGIGGNLAAAAVPYGLGWLETRFPHQDGGPGQLGPLPYPVVGALVSGVAGAALTGVLDMPFAGAVASHVASGCAGAASVTVGRAHGAKARARAIAASNASAAVKGGASSGVLTPEEARLLADLG
jgi:hypothetical protein